MRNLYFRFCPWLKKVACFSSLLSYQIQYNLVDLKLIQSMPLARNVLAFPWEFELARLYNSQESLTRDVKEWKAFHQWSASTTFSLSIEKLLQRTILVCVSRDDLVTKLNRRGYKNHLLTPSLTSLLTHSFLHLLWDHSSSQYHPPHRKCCLCRPIKQLSKSPGPQFLGSTSTESCEDITSFTGKGLASLLIITWFKSTSQHFVWLSLVSKGIPRMGFVWRGSQKSGLGLEMVFLAIHTP